MLLVIYIVFNKIHYVRSLENDDSYIGFWKDDKRNLFGVNQEDLLETFAGQYYQGLVLHLAFRLCFYIIREILMYVWP